MKKRIIALCLAAALLLGMMPALTLPISAELAGPSHLAANAVGVAVDGALEEEAWYTSGKIGSAASFGALWDKENLYLAVKPGEATELTAKLADKTLTVDKTAGVSGIQGAEAVWGTDAVEISVPVTALNLTLKTYNEAVAAVLTVGEDTWEGSLVISSLVRKAPNFAITASGKDKSNVTNTKPSGDNSLKVTNYWSEDKELQNQNTIITYYQYTAMARPGTTMVLDFDFEATKMPGYYQSDELVEASAIYATYGLCFMNGNGDGKGINAGITNTTDDGLYLCVNSPGGGAGYEAFKLNKQVGDKFHIRMERTSKGIVTFYVDDAPIAKLDNPTITGSWGRTKDIIVMAVNCGDEYTPTADGKNDLDISVTNIYNGECADNLLDLLTFDDIKGDNRSDKTVETNLELITSWTHPALGTEQTIAWGSSDADAVDPATGKVTLDLEDKDVLLTAKLGSYEKVFPVTVLKKSVRAYFTQEPMVLDGRNSEFSWGYTKTAPFLALGGEGAPTGSVSALMNAGVAYLAVQYADAQALTVELGEKSWNLDLTKSIFTAEGVHAAIGSGVVEMRIDMKALGMQILDYHQECAFQLTLTKGEKTSKLEESKIALVFEGKYIDAPVKEEDSGIISIPVSGDKVANYLGTGGVDGETLVLDTSTTGYNGSLDIWQYKDPALVKFNSKLTFEQTLTVEALTAEYVFTLNENNAAGNDWRYIKLTVYNAGEDALAMKAGSNSVALGKSVGDTFKLTTVYSHGNVDVFVDDILVGTLPGSISSGGYIRGGIDLRVIDASHTTRVKVTGMKFTKDESNWELAPMESTVNHGVDTTGGVATFGGTLDLGGAWDIWQYKIQGKATDSITIATGAGDLIDLTGKVYLEMTVEATALAGSMDFIVENCVGGNKFLKASLTSVEGALKLTIAGQTVDLGKRLNGGAFKLGIKSVAGECTIYVDGQKAGTVDNGISTAVHNGWASGLDFRTADPTANVKVSDIQFVLAEADALQVVEIPVSDKTASYGIEIANDAIQLGGTLGLGGAWDIWQYKIGATDTTGVSAWIDLTQPVLLEQTLNIKALTNVFQITLEDDIRVAGGKFLRAEIIQESGALKLKMTSGADTAKVIELGKNVGDGAFRLGLKSDIENLSIYVDGVLKGTIEGAFTKGAGYLPGTGLDYRTADSTADIEVSEIVITVGQMDEEIEDPVHALPTIQEELAMSVLLPSLKVNDVTENLDLAATFTSPWLGELPLAWSSTNAAVLNAETGAVTRPNGKTHGYTILAVKVAGDLGPKLWDAELRIPTTADIPDQMTGTVQTPFNQNGITLESAIKADDWSLNNKLLTGVTANGNLLEGKLYTTFGAQWDLENLYVLINSAKVNIVPTLAQAGVNVNYSVTIDGDKRIFSAPLSGYNFDIWNYKNADVMSFAKNTLVEQVLDVDALAGEMQITFEVSGRRYARAFLVSEDGALKLEVVQTDGTRVPVDLGVRVGGDPFKLGVRYGLNACTIYVNDEKVGEVSDHITNSAYSDAPIYDMRTSDATAVITATELKMTTGDDITLKVNGKDIVLNAQNSTIVDGFTKVILPMRELGLEITEYNVKVSAEVIVGEASWKGDLVLTSNDNFIIDGAAERIPNDLMLVGKSGAGQNNAVAPIASQGVGKTDDGWNLYDRYTHGVVNPTEVRTYAILYPKKTEVQEYLDMTAPLDDRTRATYVEFDLTVDSMPVYSGSDTTAGGSLLYASCGFTWAVTGADNYMGAELSAAGVSMGIYNSAEGLMFTVLGVSEHIKLNKVVGDQFRIATRWEIDGSLTLYIDGEKLANIPGAQRTFHQYGCNSLLLNTVSSATPKQGTQDNIDVRVSNISIAKGYGDKPLDLVTYSTIMNTNTDRYQVTGDMNLPVSVTNPQTGWVTDLEWSSSDTTVIDPVTGEVTQPEGKGKLVTLTALAGNDRKEFQVYVPAKNAEGNTMVKEDDLDTATGAGQRKDMYLFTLDTDNSSIILDQGEGKKINVIKLTDGDEINRLNESVLTIWVSDDNKTYTRVDGYFKLLRDGKYTYLYDFEAEGRYIKVHCTHYNGAEADFTGPLDGMITASWEDVFAAEGEFENSAEVTVENGNHYISYDDAWTVPLAAAGVAAGDTASIRAYLDGELLYHYVDGSDLIVRIPEIAANGSVKLTVLSGNDTAKDISNREYVYEVVYGTREVTEDTPRRWVVSLNNGVLFGAGIATDLIDDGRNWNTASAEVKARRDGIFGSFSYDGGLSWTPAETIAESWSGNLEEDGWANHMGGLCYDPDVGDKGRIILYANYLVGFDGGNMDNSVCIPRFLYSDDLGQTWTRSEEIVKENPADPINGGTVPYSGYAVGYADPIKVSCYDGAGPNVDYVVTTGAQANNNGGFCCRSIYSVDGGISWIMSNDIVQYEAGAGITAIESGVSEAFLMERERDNVLVLYARCQFANSDKMAIAFSEDFGKTWSEAKLSSVYTSTGQPVMKPFGDENLMIWGGNHALGANTYFITPFTIGVFSDDLLKVSNIQDIFSRYSTQGMTTMSEVRIINPSAAFAGDTMSITTWSRPLNLRWRIDNLTDYLYRTKGAFDSFENSTIKYEGWEIILGTAAISDNVAKDGTKSMLLNGGSSALRSIPYLQDGSVRYWVYVEDADTANFTFELEAAYSDVYGKAAPAGFEVIDGELTFLHADSASGLTLVDGWNLVSFDLNLSAETPTVKLSLNGAPAVDMPVDTTCTNQDGECDDPICNNYICYLDIHAASEVYVDAMTVVDTMPVVMHEAPEDPDPCFYGHTPEIDDGDCTTDIQCSVCGEVTTEGNASHTGGTATCEYKAECAVCGTAYGELAAHKPEADDGDCTTDIKCTVCDKVTTEGNAAHTGGTATCEKKAECSVCGKEYGDLADHIPEADDGDCTTDIKCTVCDKVTTEANAAHTGGTATCEHKAECAVCGKEYGNLAAHTPEKDDGDCTTDINCSVCGEVATKGNAAHSGGEATCKNQAVCSICGKSYGALNAINHEGIPVWTVTETTHGQTYTCCGEPVVEEEDHEWINGICSECGHHCAHTGGTATCKDKAVCTVCGESYGELLKTHVPEKDDGDCTTDIQCSVCGEVTTEGNEAHTGGTATCEKKAECTVCGTVYGELAAHKPETDDGDCTTPIKCTVCGEEVEAAASVHTGGAATCEHKAECAICGKEYGNLAAHTPEKDDGDCTTAIKCTVCGEEVEAAASVHTGGTATCEKKAECAICGKEYGELAAHKGGEATCCDKAKCEVCGKEYGALNASNHTKDAKWSHTTDKHSKTYECCGAVEVAEEAHEFVDNKCECGYEKPADSGDNSQTGDTTNLALVLALNTASVLALAVLLLNRKKWFA